MDVDKSASDFPHDDEAEPVSENEGVGNLDLGVIEPSLGNVDPHPDNGTVGSRTAKKRRKRTSLRKAFRRRKRRGQKNKNSLTTPTAPPLGLGDPDLAECLLSDDEDRANCLEDLQSFQIHLLNKAAAPDDPDICEPSFSACSSESDRQVSVNADSVLEEPCPVSLCEMSTSEISAVVTSNVSDAICLTQTQCDEIHHVENVPITAYTQCSNSTSSTICSPVPISNEHTDLQRDVSRQHEQGDLEQPEQPAIFGRHLLPAELELPSPSACFCMPSDLTVPTSSSEVPVNEELSSTSASPSAALIEKTVGVLRSRLRTPWIPVADRFGIHALQLSCTSTKTVQKQVSITYEGDEDILVHCTNTVHAKKILDAVSPGAVKLQKCTMGILCDRLCNIVKILQQYQLCLGADNQDRKGLWDYIADAYTDRNPFYENSYEETCRSSSCERLILLGRGKRCGSCVKLQTILRKRKPQSFSVHANTNNRYLSTEQAQEKLKTQYEQIRRKDKQIQYLKKKVDTILEAEGVDVDFGLNEDLSSTLCDAKLNPFQKIFLEEQVKYTARTDKRGHRWHPAMVRLALHIKMISTSAYEALRDSGAIKFPSTRTLFDYSRPFPAQTGVSEGPIEMVAQNVSKLKPHKQYVSLIADEVSVSRNLVYRKSDGILIGYGHLEEIEEEMKRLERCLEGREDTKKNHLANKILAFMVKGILSDVKCVVADYPCNQLTRDMLHSRCWKVISRLERAGVKVLNVVSDGCSVNRAFIDMHTPITKTKSGIKFDTLNVCSLDERPLFFIADVAHLLKTIRNCFFSSGLGPKKTRCLEIDGEQIVWYVIVKLYLHYKQFTLRKSYKLNAQNVFPNSYSCMKVRFAAEVLSATVALDIEQLKWPGTKQVVKFLRLVNRFFDCLNGAHSYQHIRTRNADFAPYTDVNDPRFDWLENEFLGYFERWRNQVKALPITPEMQNKKMLSTQTQEGMEIAIKGFIGATKFLLQEANKCSQKIFIMARAFSQDPLEQHFSKQRAAGGGSANPNVSQFLSNQVSISIQRDLGTKRKGSNLETLEEVDVNQERLAKRPRRK